MSEKHPGPLVVEGKLTDAERMKHESNYLRGTIAEDLNDGLTGGFKGDTSRRWFIGFNCGDRL